MAERMAGKTGGNQRGGVSRWESPASMTARHLPAICHIHTPFAISLIDLFKLTSFLIYDILIKEIIWES